MKKSFKPADGQNSQYQACKIQCYNMEDNSNGIRAKPTLPHQKVSPKKHSRLLQRNLSESQIFNNNSFASRKSFQSINILGWRKSAESLERVNSARMLNNANSKENAEKDLALSDKIIKNLKKKALSNPVTFQISDLVNFMSLDNLLKPKNPFFPNNLRRLSNECEQNSINSFSKSIKYPPRNILEKEAHSLNNNKKINIYDLNLTIFNYKSASIPFNEKPKDHSLSNDLSEKMQDLLKLKAPAWPNRKQCGRKSLKSNIEAKNYYERVNLSRKRSLINLENKYDYSSLSHPNLSIVIPNNKKSHELKQDILDTKLGQCRIKSAKKS